jgi:hypothetical protein
MEGNSSQKTFLLPLSLFKSSNLLKHEEPGVAEEQSKNKSLFFIEDSLIQKAPPLTEMPLSNSRQKHSPQYFIKISTAWRIE